jgi:hypothetical protein
MATRSGSVVILALLSLGADCRGEPDPPDNEAVCVDLEPGMVGLTCDELCPDGLGCADHFCAEFPDYSARFHAQAGCVDADPQKVTGCAASVVLDADEDGKPDLASVECCCASP